MGLQIIGDCTSQTGIQTDTVEAISVEAGLALARVSTRVVSTYGVGVALGRLQSALVYVDTLVVALLDEAPVAVTHETSLGVVTRRVLRT